MRENREDAEVVTGASFNEGNGKVRDNAIHQAVGH